MMATLLTNPVSVVGALIPLGMMVILAIQGASVAQRLWKARLPADLRARLDPVSRSGR